MKVIDVLKLSSCKVDIYYKGQYVTRYEDYKDLNNIEEWLLKAEVRDFDVMSTNAWGDCHLEIDSE
ncbi:hypothetical protein [Paraclostridium bifermentans]|uniref:hypothetical protein n=1 Tax=Paraclostridium bifermentans TaxID=1490 RepID=UPI00189D7C8E|nr:hypothetical protein [Paraclostridium bifermentans]